MMGGHGLITTIVAGATLGLLAAAEALAAPFAYVANFGNPPSISVIDLATETEVANLPTGGGDPYWAAVSRDGRIAAVTLHDDTGVALVDGRTNTLLGIVPGVGNEPEGVAVSSDGRTVYVADENPSSSSEADLYVVDVATRQVVAGPIDFSDVCEEPENLVISPDDRFLYVACAVSSTGTVARIATSNFAVKLIDSDLDDAHGIALNCAGTRLYYSNGDDAFEFDTRSQSLTGTTFDDCELYGGGVSPDGTKLYCVEENDSVKIYDTASGTLLQEVALGASNATAVAVHPNNSKAYIPISGVDAVEVVDAELLLNLPGNIAVGDRPRGIAIANCSSPEPVPVLGLRPLVLLAALMLALGVAVLSYRNRLQAQRR